MRPVIRMGTRGSLLALTQSSWVKDRLQRLLPEFDFELVIIKTQGDQYQAVELFKKNQTGVFTKELEKKLLSKEIDLAVHSLKDLPTDLPRGLCMAAYPKREAVNDVLISRRRWTLRTLPKGAVVGTGSPRRLRQLERLRPDLKLVEIRGNLDTRIRRVLIEKKYDAVVLAKAGLKRVNRWLKYAVDIPSTQLFPAVGQGALGIQARRTDKALLTRLAAVDHQATRHAVEAEREFLKRLRGGCRVPVGMLCRVRGGRISMAAGVYSTHSTDAVEATASGAAVKRLQIARRLAQTLLKKGARDILRQARAVL